MEDLEDIYKEIDELGDNSLTKIDKVVNEFAEVKREMELDDAYRQSPSEYNELFDDFQRYDREVRKVDGTYSMDDFLDDLEEQREKDSARRR